MSHPPHKREPPLTKSIETGKVGTGGLFVCFSFIHDSYENLVSGRLDVELRFGGGFESELVDSPSRWGTGDLV